MEMCMLLFYHLVSPIGFQAFRVFREESAWTSHSNISGNIIYSEHMARQPKYQEARTHAHTHTIL